MVLGSAPAQTIPSYDISTVKPHDASDGNVSVSSSAAVLKISNMSARDLIAMAWDVRPWLVSGLPPWAKSEHFDLNAKVSEPDMATLRALPDEDRRRMAQMVLTERFHMAVHAETRTLPVYELSVVPEGAKLKPSPPLPPPEAGEPAPRRSRSVSSGDGHITGRGMTVRALADTIAKNLQRYVVDKTALTGDYDIDLSWTPEDSNPADAGVQGEPAPAMATAVREQLGLKLTPAKGPVPTVVVDHIQMPEDN